MITQIVEATGGSMRQVCRVLELPRSSFYHAAAPTPTEVADKHIGSLIEAIFKLHRRRYGYRRIREELVDRGVVCAAARIRRLMAQRGLRAIQPKNYVPKTSDGRADKPSPNLLVDKPLPDAPNRVWAGDITFIPVESGWLYLAVVIDLCSRRIVGWSLGDHLRSDLVLAALQQALGSQPTHQTIFHRPRQPICQQRLSSRLGRRRHAPKHVPPGQPLRQRLDRILHWHPKVRNASRRLFPKRL
jgi:transposase InsO family protein